MKYIIIVQFVIMYLIKILRMKKEITTEVGYMKNVDNDIKNCFYPVEKYYNWKLNQVL